MDEMLELIEDFVSDCFELLDAAEEDLLELEESPDQETINRIFRSFHSVKGSAAMLGFTQTSEFAHMVEDLFMDVRSGKVAIDKGIADRLLIGIDGLKDGIGNIRESGADGFDYSAPRQALDQMDAAATKPAPTAQPTQKPEKSREPEQPTPDPAPVPVPEQAPNTEAEQPAADKSLPPTPPPPTTDQIFEMHEPKDVSVFTRKGGAIKSLVVDDEFTARMVLSTYLTRFGTCHVAKDGAEAVEAVRKSFEGPDAEPYDLICVDIMMPVMDGITATRIIRDVESEMGINDSDHEATILITTAIDDEHVAFQAIYEAGGNNYFTKPLSFKEIHRCLVISALLPPIR